MADDTPLVLSEITIQRIMIAGADAVAVRTVNDDYGMAPSVIEILGMLEWAKDMVLKEAAASLKDERE